MTETIQLIQVIGSPFDNKRSTISFTENEIKRLYLLAQKNKIGLTFLNALNDCNLIEKYSLTEVFQEERKRYTEQCKTVTRISSLLNSIDASYAVFKSRMPFEATPNDTDIIHFGTKKEFARIIDIMRENGYVEASGFVDSQQKMLHDSVLGGDLNPHPKVKDVYDVDIYQEISASYLHYITKGKIQTCVLKRDDQIIGSYKSLNNEAELMTIIVHSIIPEIINTLFVYYATLHYIKIMDNDQIEKFIQLVKDNHVSHCVKVHMTIVATLHEKAHGHLPDKIKYIIDALGYSNMEYTRIVQTNYIMPFKYSGKTLLRAIAEKMGEFSFIPSLFNQGIRMLHPKMLYWVASQVYIRFNRETY